jgi:hypothetical protein
VLANLRIAGNHGGEGAAMYLSGSSSRIFNTLISGNRGEGYFSAAVHVSGGAPALTNVTISGNNYPSIAMEAGANITMRNGIIWGNANPNGRESDNFQVNGAGGSITFSNSLIEYWGVAPLVQGRTDGGGNRNLNPRFADPRIYSAAPTAEGDYRPVPGSPAINAGSEADYKNSRNISDFADETELGGVPRLSGVKIDIGAYEYPVVPIFPNISYTSGIVYVRDGGMGNMDGSSWENAYPNLADPLLLAAHQHYGTSSITPLAQGDTICEIRVAAATYRPLHKAGNGASDHDKAFVLVPGVKVYGGFPATPTTLSHPTLESRGATIKDFSLATLSGDLDGSGTITPDDARHVVIGADIAPGTGAALDGFIVTGGNALTLATGVPDYITVNGEQVIRDGGGGISNVRSSPAYRNLVIRENYGHWAAVYNSNSSPSITWTAIVGNNTNLGGAMYNSNSSPSLTDVLISGNLAQSQGSIMYNIGAGAAPVLTNVTIAGNIYNGLYPTSYGIYGENGAPGPAIRNTIIWGNYDIQNGGTFRIFHGGYSSVSNSLVQGVDLTGQPGCPDGTLSASDPLFESPVTGSSVPVTGGDYSLKAGSPALNAGDNALYTTAMNISAMTGATDLAGNARLAGAKVDMGAYERQAVAADIVPDAQGVVYVKQGGAGKKDGSSWTNAYPNLADPLWVADGQRSQTTLSLTAADTIRRIWVAEGTYCPMHIAGSGTTDRDKAFVLVKGVQLYGGFADNLSDVGSSADSLAQIDGRGFGLYGQATDETVLSGDIGNLGQTNDNALHVVVAAGIPASGIVTLDGFTVAGGNANGSGNIGVNGATVYSDYGGGIYNSGAALRLANSRVVANSASIGAGIYKGSSASIVMEMENAALKGNNASNYGGGMCSGGTSAMNNVLVSENTAVTNGGGLSYLGGSTFAMNNVIVAGNSAASSGAGGGIYIESMVSAKMTNVAVTGNKAGNQGGGIFSNSSFTLTNGTVSGNKSNSNYGGGIHGNAKLLVYNSIVWGNRSNNSGNHNVFTNNASTSFANCILQGCGGSGGGWIGSTFKIDGGNNIDGDPQFVNWIDPASGGWTATVAGNYRLQCASPALNAGDSVSFKTAAGISSMTGATDLDGNARLFGANVDMGAYERQKISCIQPDSRGIVYVREGAAGDGSSWSDAYKNLADPLLLADNQRKGNAGTVDAADTIRRIWVAEGTYKPMHIAGSGSTDRDKAFVLVKGVKLYGGFADTLSDVASSADSLRQISGRIFGQYGDAARETVLSGRIGNSGNADDSVHHVVIAVNFAAADSVTLDGFTITGGNANGIAYSYISVDNETIYRHYGGGLYNRMASPVLSRVRIVGNRALQGGGILNDGSGSNLVLKNVTLSGNAITSLAPAGGGGGIYNLGSSLRMTEVIIGNNTSITKGGGFYNENATLEGTKVSIVGNKAAFGGGIISLLGSVKLTYAVISGNSAVYSTIPTPGGGTVGGGVGGGVYNALGCPMVLTNALISGNSAVGSSNGWGGGVYNSADATFSWTNVTISGNEANSGGGIYNGSFGSAFTLQNSIIWGNKAASNANVYASSAAHLTHKRNLLEGGSSWLSAFGTDGGNNIDGDPQFVNWIDPASGGWTATVAGNYRLQCASPALNAGDSVSFKTAAGILLMSGATDLDGNARLFGANIDMGAYERQKISCIQPDARGIVYVNHTKTGDGSSWDDAYKNLADPLLLADMQRKGTAGTVDAVDTIQHIWVAEGTYFPLHKAAEITISGGGTGDRDRAFALVAGVKVYGGFPVGATNSSGHDNTASRFAGPCVSPECLPPTILSGDIDGSADAGDAMTGFSNNGGNAYHVVVAAGLSAGDSVVLDGFRISGGNADGTDSIRVNNEYIGRHNGGGVALNNASLALCNLIVEGNSSRDKGAGICSGNSNYRLNNSSVLNNRAASYGGGIHNGGGKGPFLLKAQIRGNFSGANGGGISNHNLDTLLMTNVLVAENVASDGGGIYNFTVAGAQLANITVVRNEALSGAGGMSNIFTQVSFEVVNSIFWGNTGSTYYNIRGNQHSNTVMARYRNTLVEGSNSLSWSELGVDGGNNIDANPLFVDAPNGDYRITPCSPARDKGDSLLYKAAAGISVDLHLDPLYSSDLGFESRLFGAQMDMGAFESNRKYCVNPNRKGVVFVNRPGNGRGDGSSWENAYPNLGDPLLVAGLQRRGLDGRLLANDTVRQIWVAAGTYYPLHKASDTTVTGASTDTADRAFVLVAGVKLYGGFPKNAKTATHSTVESRGSSLSIFDSKLTVLSGDIDSLTAPDGAGFVNMAGNAHHVIIAAGIKAADSVALDGFAVRGGNAAGAHSIPLNGIAVSASSGGGIANYNSSYEIRNVTVEANSASRSGGGIYSYGSDLALLLAAAVGNRASDGGGLYAENSGLSANMVSVRGNLAGASGGGILIAGGVSLARNTVVSGNASASGGGVETSGSARLTLLNVTVAGNSASGGGSSGGLLVGGSSIAELHNSIVWGNVAGTAAVNLLKASFGAFGYNASLAGGSAAWTAGYGTDLGGNIDTVPSFVNWLNPLQTALPVAAGDYRLKCISSAIGAGRKHSYDTILNITLPAGETDVRTNPRLYGAEIDMGAFENDDSICIRPDANGVVYVNELKAGPGKSWEDAYPNLADPLMIAGKQYLPSGTTTATADTIRRIWVAAGTYRPKHNISASSADPRTRSFLLARKVKVYGGFPANASTSVHNSIESRGDIGSILGSRLSVLSGDIGVQGDSTDNSFHVVTGANLSAADSVVLDGFTITKGRIVGNKNNVNEGVDVDGVSIVHAYGAGIHLAYASVTLSKLVVTRNTGDNSAGGAVAGGGIYITYSDATLRDMIVSGNSLTGGGGGGIVISSSSPTLTNMLVSGNKAAAGGGIYNMADAFPVMTNLTIAGNRAESPKSPGSGNGGMYNVHNSAPVVRNSIIWGNFKGVGIAGTPSVGTYENCLIQGIDNTGSSGLDGTNPNNDPRFLGWIDPDPTGWTPTDAGDCRLHCSSPAINAGDSVWYMAAMDNIPDMTGTIDLDGSPRLHKNNIDLGAFESHARFCIIPDSRGIVYVNEIKTGNGSSWEYAYVNLADPLLLADIQRKGTETVIAADTIRQIWVAAGTYYPLHKIAEKDAPGRQTGDRDKAFLLVKGVKLYGGFPSAASTSSNGTVESRGDRNYIISVNSTVLSGDIDGDPDSGDAMSGFSGMDNNAYHVVIAVGANAADSMYIDGFDVRGGYASDHQIIGVPANGKFVLRGNGGGLYAKDCALDMRNFTIAGNRCHDGGAGLFLDGVSLRMVGGAIRNNRVESSDHGGGMYLSSGDTASIVDVLVADNRAGKYGGGIFAEQSYSLTNVTIVGNKAEYNGSGIMNLFYSSETADVRNSIIWGNQYDNAYTDGNYPAALFRRSIVGGTITGYGWPYTGTDGGDNLDLDPLFVDPTVGDYRLQNLSPAINKGDSVLYMEAMDNIPDMTGTIDLTGELRLKGLNIDMGAYEVQLVIIGTGSIDITQPVASDTLVCISTPVTLKGIYDNPQLAVLASPLDFNYYWIRASDTIGASVQPDTVKRGTLTLSGGKLTSDSVFASIRNLDEGFYKFAIENSSGFAQYFTLSSRYVRVEVFEPHKLPDVRLHVTPAATMSVHLISYLDTARYPAGTTRRWIAQPGSPPLAAGTETNKGTIDLSACTTAKHTYPYIHELNACAPRRSKVYLHTTDKYRRTDTIEICIGAGLSLNSVINLNPILGVLSQNGAVSYPDDPTSAILSNVQLIANGSLMLNVEKAYADATDAAYSYKGDLAVKKFEIQYSDANTNISRKIILIVKRL